MDLKEFIKETISAIADATSELQEEYLPSDVLVNPPSAQSGSDVFQVGSSNYTMRRVKNISFDVAVTAASETSAGGKAVIKVLSFEVGGQGKKSHVAEHVSRVKFDIPITLKPSEHEAKNISKRDQQRQKDDAVVSSYSAPNLL